MEAGSMKLTTASWLKITAVVLFGLWFGLCNFRIWQADKFVDELCAKDGGIKVYQTVTLPKERFNQWGQFRVLDKRVMNSNDEYYSVWEMTNIQGRQELHGNALAIYQEHFTIYRVIDKKILGEAIIYVRRGGDAIGLDMSSSYSCPDVSDIELSKQIFKIK